MKKILIYYPENNLAPTGGPAGYLWNLRQGLNNLEFDDIRIDFYNTANKRFESNTRLRSVIPKRILEIRRAIDYARFTKKKIHEDESLNAYDYIHFHWTEEMYLNRDFLQNFKGKVILTSHSPCAMHKEKIDRLNPKDYRLLRKKIDCLEQMDIYSFTRADHIIFPCKEAEEPYFHTWMNYSKIRNESKYHYMPTGIVGCKAKSERTEVRKKIGIPEDAFVISYAGRHNEIKGYGDLKKIGDMLLNKYPNIYFLIAGQQEPLIGLDHERWIEVGWTNDPHSLIAASDLFILPNRETYFDLILLEVISLGVPILMSNTGGNKYFQRFNCKGFMFYESIDEAILNVSKRIENSVFDSYEMQEDILRVFNENFTVEQFSKNYLSVLRQIIEKDEINN